MDLNQTAHRISEKFAAAGQQIDPAKIEEKISRFVNEFGIPPQEAERSIISEYSRQYNLEAVAGGPVSKADTEDITLIIDVQSGEWITLEGMVIVLFPPRSPSVAQSGIFADRSGTLRFTVWAKAHAPVLELGKWYRIESAVADEYNGQLNFKVHSGTTITPLSDDEIPQIDITPVGELQRGVVSLEGKVVSISRREGGVIGLTGVIADGTGAIRFTIRQDDPVQEPEEGAWYRISSAIADVYRGAMSLQFNAGTVIKRIEDDRSLRPAIIPVAEVKPGVVCIRVKVVQEYESTSERIFQSGLLGDETGTIRFVTWKDADAERLTPGSVYIIYYVSADEYNNRASLTLNGATCLVDVEGNIEVKNPGEEVSGALVHISPGSGLIKRCPVEGCGRVLTRQNYCQIHEIQPDFTYDLRIKGWLDDGNKTWDTIINREGVEKLLGLTLAAAQEMAENSPLGLETVYYHLCEQVLGRYLTCMGRVFENRLVTGACAFMPFDSGKHAELINRAGGESHE
ncbi:MAG TPA: nucleotide-binding protein [Methanospirillum sp.]|nr:nucleotide-binding protein [Methanospirillum sp.]